MQLKADQTSSEVSQSKITLNPVALLRRTLTHWLGRELLVIGFYLLLAIVFTWPLILHLREWVIGLPKTIDPVTYRINYNVPLNTVSPDQLPNGDVLQTMLGFGILRENLEHFSNPFYTKAIFYPTGTSLYLSTYQILNGLISLPVQYLLRGAGNGAVAAYNFIVLLAFTANAYSMFCLTRYVLRTRRLAFWAALAAGVSFGFSSYHLAQLAGHLNLISTEFIPLYVLFLLKTLEQDAKWRRYAVLTGLCLLANVLIDYQFVIYLLVFTLSLFGYLLVKALIVHNLQRWWHNLGRTILAAAVAVIPGGLILGPGLVQALAFSSKVVAPSAGVFNADLLSYFLPSPTHSLWGQAAFGLRHNLRIFYVESTLFPTFTVYLVLLAGLGVYSWSWLRRLRNKVGMAETAPITLPITTQLPIKTGFWVLIAAVFFVLSFGSYLFIDGNSYFSYMPGGLINAVPVINILRVTARFGVLVILSLSLLGAITLCYLLQILSHYKFWSFSLQRGLAIGLIALIVLELCPIPYTQVPYSVPEVYRQIGAENNNSVILELPFDQGPADWQALYMVHRKPIINGYLSRQPDYPLRTRPIFSEFAGLGDSDDAEVYKALTESLQDVFPNNFNLSELKRYNVGYVIVHREIISEKQEQDILDLLNLLKIGAPFYQDKLIIAYRIPPNVGVTASQITYGVDAADMYSPETIGPGRHHRWLKSTTPEILLRSDIAETIKLRLPLASLQGNYQVSLAINDQPLGSWQVGTEIANLDVTLPLQAGKNHLTFKIEGQPVRPGDIGLAKDNRLLTLQLFDVRVLP